MHLFSLNVYLYFLFNNLKMKTNSSFDRFLIVFCEVAVVCKSLEQRKYQIPKSVYRKK